MHGVSDPEGNQAIVRATIALGHDLGLTVTGEGVEDESARETMSGLGCDCLQGAAIARPMPPDVMLAWARADGRRHRMSFR